MSTLPPDAADKVLEAFKPLADMANAHLAERQRQKLKDLILRRDGNAWMVAASDFINLQESIAGFGETPTDAHADYLKNLGDCP